MSGLELYNSRTRRKEPFEPLTPGEARVYSCGPTVYSKQHLGNMRASLFADLLRRALEHEGLRVRHVVNVTDVGHLTQDDEDQGEDKMEKAARESGRRAEDVAAEYTAQWQRDLARLNVIPPEVLCKATEHLGEQIDLIRVLEQKGVTYRIDDGLYFDVSRFPRYAELARLDLARPASGRIAAVKGKRNPQDFALWKFSDPAEKRQQEWDSPWGRGFPGWHIECSAMSTKYLGEQFDIHTGGVEHLPVHHTNEIAQSETAFDVHPWVNVWMHEDWLLFEGGKMSKSLGHVLCLDDLALRGVLPLAYRFFFLQAHYRKQQHFNGEAIGSADRGYRRLVEWAQGLPEGADAATSLAAGKLRRRFWDAVGADLNAPRAVALLHELQRDPDVTQAEKRSLVEEFDAWLGLDLLAAELPGAAGESEPRIDALVRQREEARARKDFAEADRLRDELAAEGVVIEDTPEGPRWKRG